MPVPHDQPEYRVYLWNVTNVDEMKNQRAKPKIEQVGPICFDFEIKTIYFMGIDLNLRSFNKSKTEVLSEKRRIES